MNRKKYPAWIPCPSCDDFFCTIHLLHAYDCKCPSIERWKTYPYEEGGKPDPFKAERKLTAGVGSKRQTVRRARPGAGEDGK